MRNEGGKVHLSYRWHSDCQKKEACENCKEPCAEEMKKRELYDPRVELEPECDDLDWAEYYDEYDESECCKDKNGELIAGE